MWQVVTYIGGQRVVVSLANSRIFAHILMARAYVRDFVQAAFLLVNDGIECVPLRFRIEYVMES